MLAAAYDEPFDLVVLDPPREGAAGRWCAQIVDRAPRAVAYVACDPAALARDLAIFAELGYALRDLRAFDLFPMTSPCGVHCPSSEEVSTYGQRGCAAVLDEDRYPQPH